ncbi:MAG: RdgB/HAM1 family non-canonical purine NTP pyrophosphatase [Candidatus Atribacteria bacterium]|nr:RdgB/HAM1 family non-canonical purine NTP pyrophosphatase [Candidatus Atribacteria bacterium]
MKPSSQLIYILSKNQGKIKEINTILSPYALTIRSLFQDYSVEEVIETGSNYAENALLKARRGFKISGNMCIGEDSGLEIDALNGAPGLFSARFGGEGLNSKEKNKKIIELLKEVPKDQRSACFVCVVALVWQKGEKIFEGRCLGFISQESRGRSGFGYDPIFVLPPYQKTFAELGEKIKNRLSHRAIAFRKLAEFLLSELEGNISLSL